MKEARRVFIDTNLFLRYLTNDVPEQADAFGRLARQAAAGNVTLIINCLVVAEIVWTLESYYHLSPVDIREKVLAIINSPGVELPDQDIVVQAIAWYAEANVDFIDAYSAAWMLAQGIDTVCTFDRRHFARLEGITVEVPAGTPS